VEEFHKVGVDVPLTDPVPGGDHRDGILPSFMQAFKWFLSFEGAGSPPSSD